MAFACAVFWEDGQFMLSSGLHFLSTLVRAQRLFALAPFTAARAKQFFAPSMSALSFTETHKSMD